MNYYTSPTPRPSGLHEPPASHRTMEARVSRNQAELQQAMSARKSTRSMSVNERDDLERRCQQLQQRQADLEQELARCKVTIQTQSQIIQKPSSAQKPFHQTQFEKWNSHPNIGPYPRPTPPPRFDPSGTIATAKNALRQSGTFNSMPQAQPSTGNGQVTRPAQPAYNQSQYRQGSDFPQPFHQQNISPPPTNPYIATVPGTLGYGLTAEQRAQPPTPIHTANESHGGHHLQNQPSHNSYQPSQCQLSSNKPSYSSPSPYPAIPQQYATKLTPPMSTALVIVTNTAQDLGFPAKFEALFTMSERYAFSHVNFPSSAKDSMLSSYIKNKLELIAGKSAGNLMSNGQTRYHIVARVINQWISKHVLRRTCFNGLDKEIDANIEIYAGSIYQTTPNAVRGQLLNNIAKEAHRLKAHPQFQQFFYQRCKDRGNDLWAIVYPMMHRKTSKDWEDMMSLMVEAHNLAGMMLGGPYEWSFTFHDVGAPFQQNMMANKDPFLRGFVEADLQAKGAVVRLGVSPLVGFRTYNNATLEASNMNKAFVLTKWPQF